MKNKQTFIGMILTLLLAMFAGGLLANCVGAPPAVGLIGGPVLSIIMGLIPMPEMSFRAGLLREVWISQLMEKFYSNWDFMNRSQDMSEFVYNNVINLAEAGVDPEVLINNTVYPVPISERDDTPLTLPLKYLDTENTVVRNAIAKQTSYSQMESVIRGHRNALSEKCASLSCHAWAPAANGEFSPVFSATGADRGDGTKMLRLQDVARAQKLLTDIKTPMKGRVLLLSSQHQEDLINQDVALFKAFANLKAGEILPLYGFDVMVTQLVPLYNMTTGAKKAYGAATAGTDTVASMFFQESEVMRAEGTYDMFFQEKTPEQRGDVVGFQKFFIGLSIRGKHHGAIFSGEA